MGLRYNALCIYRARQIYLNLKFKDKVLICNAAETSGLLSTRQGYLVDYFQRLTLKKVIVVCLFKLESTEKLLYTLIISDIGLRMRDYGIKHWDAANKWAQSHFSAASPSSFSPPESTSVHRLHQVRPVLGLGSPGLDLDLNAGGQMCLLGARWY